MTKREALRRLLFPDRLYCISCGAIIDETSRYGLCGRCIRRFSWVGSRTCSRCGKVLAEDASGGLCRDCAGQEHIFDRGYTCTSYGLYERLLVADFKDGGRPWLAREMAEMMADRIAIEGETFDLIVPVPSDPGKLRKRGFHQTGLLARFAAERLGIPAEPALVKTKSTPPMRTLGREERRMNVRDVYRAAPGAERRLKGKRVLLLDDVYTTGSTADACALALKEAGAARVTVLTLAAGGNSPDWKEADLEQEPEQEQEREPEQEQEREPEQETE